MKKKKPHRHFMDWRERAKERLHPGSMENYVTQAIGSRDWLEYIASGLTVAIERSLANAMLLATKGQVPEPNEMDVLQGLAAYHVCQPYKDKLAKIVGDYKQLEVLLPQLKRRIYLFVDVDAGKRYVCASPIFPYAEDN
jgi:hypothetical protein